MTVSAPLVCENRMPLKVLAAGTDNVDADSGMMISVARFPLARSKTGAWSNVILDAVPEPNAGVVKLALVDNTTGPVPVVPPAR